MNDYTATYREVAQHFKLTLAAPTEGTGATYQVVVLDGEFDGVPVHVYRAAARDGRGTNYVWARATRATPGDLGLLVARKNAAASFLAGLFGVSRMTLGDDGSGDGFDSQFAVQGAEAARVRAMFTRELRAALLAWSDAARADAARHASLLWGLWSDDEHVYLELQPEAWKWTLSSRDIAVDELTRALAAVTSLARSLDAAMAQTPPSTVLAPHAAAWGAFASTRRLGFAPSPLRTWGTFGDAYFVARATATAKGQFGVELRRQFKAPLPFFLRLKPYHRFDFHSWDPDGPHERMGDKAFDGAFNVLTSDLAAARAFLTEPVRHELLELHREGVAVFVDPGGVAIQRSEMAPEGFEPTLQRIAAFERSV